MDKEKSEQIYTWTKAITAAVIAGVASYGAFGRGEPGAELTYQQLAKSFNELRGEFEKQQAFVSGFLAGLDRASSVAASAPASAPAVAPAAPVKVVALPAAKVNCAPGYNWSGTKCAATAKPKAARPAPPAPPAGRLPDALPATLQQLQKKQ